VSSWGTNTWSLFARQGGESLQPGHSWSDRSNSSDTDFEGQIGHRQPGHSGTEACCVSAPARRRVTKCQDTSSASATTFRAATFWRGNVSHRRRALAHGSMGARDLGARWRRWVWDAFARNPQQPSSPRLSTTSFSHPPLPLQNETTEHQMLYTAVFS
jgi:hypothetical protein